VIKGRKDDERHGFLIFGVAVETCARRSGRVGDEGLDIEGTTAKNERIGTWMARLGGL
jgi:hypothetical protein